MSVRCNLKSHWFGDLPCHLLRPVYRNRKNVNRVSLVQLCHPFEAMSTQLALTSRHVAPNDPQRESRSLYNIEIARLPSLDWTNFLKIHVIVNFMLF